MKRIWLAIAVIGLMAVLSSVGCSAGTSDAPAQNVQPGSPQQPAQNPSGGQPGQGGQSGPRGKQPGAFGGPGVSGTVKSVSGNTIQLSAQDGSTVTVKTDDKTAIQKNVTGALTDIQVGVRIMVIGDQSSGTTTAGTIQVMPAGESAPQAPPGQAAGQPGQGGNPPSQGSGQPGQGGGQPGQGGGQPGQGGGQPGQGGGQPGLGGTVKSLSGNTIQLTGFDGSTVTVKVDDKTTIQKTTTAALSDIQANTQITVIGDSSSGTITARMIQFGTVGK